MPFGLDFPVEGPPPDSSEKPRKNRLAGESACPTKTQALADQRGTDAFVCQPGDLSDYSRLLRERLSGVKRGATPGAFAREERFRSRQTKQAVTANAREIAMRVSMIFL